MVYVSYTESLALMIVLIVLLAGIILTVSFYFADRHFESYYRKTILGKSHSVRVFSIDMDMGTVTFFNIKTMRDVRTIPIQDFYQQFSDGEKEKVEAWLNALLSDETKADNYLEVDVRVDRDRKSYFSMLQATSVNKKEHIIHLESYLFKYVQLSKFQSSSSENITTNKNDFAAQIKNSNKNKGLTLCVKLAYKKKSEQGKSIDPAVFNSLKNELSQLLRGNKRFLLEASKDELILSDLKISNEAHGRYFIRQTSEVVNRFLSFNGLTTTLDFRIGAVEHRYYPLDAEAIVSTARSSAQLAYDSNQKYIYHNPKKKILTSQEEESGFRSEVERIIKEKRLSFYFRPLYSIEGLKVLGYTTKIVPEDAYFSNMAELKEYALRAGQSKELFETVALNLISTFEMQKGTANPIIYISIECSDFDNVLPTYNPLLETKNTRVTFLIRESDILSHLGDMGSEKISDAIHRMRDEGYRFGLVIGEKLTLPEEFYHLFDVFMVSFAFAGAATGLDTRIRADLHATVERLLKYKKHIMAIDIDGWNAIELLVRSGLNYISADAFAPYEKMLAPVSQKSLKRIKTLAKEARHI